MIYSNNENHSGAYIVYINGIEVPTKSVSEREGVWTVPELQVEMVADPVLTRLGFEDRVQVVVFYLDDIAIDPSVKPEFRLFGEGEITGWGYQNTPSGRSITFTCVNQFAIFTQLFVHFLTQLDDMVAHATSPDQGTNVISTPSSEIVFPFSLFKKGLVPGALGQDDGSITRPYDFLYNCVKNMIGVQVPAEQRTVPAVNFFTRWARLTNFHNRFAALPFFDENNDKNIFPVLKALQTTSAVDVIAKNLIPQVQNTGSIYDMLALVYQQMYMEIAMLARMPLVSVDLKTDLVITTAFEGRRLVVGTGADEKKYVSPRAPVPTQPNRLQNYFAKPQFLFGIPPTCNVIFPSQIQMMSYDENYAIQPTRLYFNDETLQSLLSGGKTGKSGLDAAIMNALATAYPPEANAVQKEHFEHNARVNGKNFLLFPEEFFKGPVMDRRPIPPWLFFLKQHEANAEQQNPTGTSADGTVPSGPTTSTAATSNPPIKLAPKATMVTGARIGKVIGGRRVFSPNVEAVRPLAEELSRSAGVPADYLLAWVENASTGDMTKISSLNERGYFQIMGPHPDNGSTAGTEAGNIGLSSEQHKALSGTDFIVGNTPSLAARRASFEPGVRLAKFYRVAADNTLVQYGFTGWTDADRWRTAKLFHGGTRYVDSIFTKAQQALGRAPKDWAEMYAAAKPKCTPAEAAVLNIATAVGGVVTGASGITVDDSGQFTSEGVQVQGPDKNSPVPQSAEPASIIVPAANEPDFYADAFEKLREGEKSVYELYAEYEFFRERYARRAGSVVMSFNPYIVPGFPMAVFDARSTRVDVCAYVTSVQQRIANQGGGTNRSTQISFAYGRTFQEMFDLLGTEFEQGSAIAGSAPREPVRDIRKVVQNFDESEALYQRLFFGNRRLYNKDASFDFRKVIGYRAETPNDPPERIFIEGTSEAQRDRLADAGGSIAKLQPQIEALVTQIEATRTQQAQARTTIGQVEETYIGQSPSAEDQARLDAANAMNIQTIATLNALEPLLDSLSAQLEAAKAVARDPHAFDTATVIHNLVGDRELVPLPSTANLFTSYDEAMAFNWRPICTLDEYVMFHDGVGEGLIPADNHPRSVGARYYERIRRFAPFTKDITLPFGADGLGTGTAGTESTEVPGSNTQADGPLTGVSAPLGDSTATSTEPPAHKVPGITSGSGPHGVNLATDFPQTREEWDKILLAYRNNVMLVKSPRT